MKHENIIITDCDGVLLNWEYAFNEWMEFNGYKPVNNYKQYYQIKEQYDLPSNNFGHKLIKEFNASAAIGFIPAHRDAQYFVKKLHEQFGYRFVVVTSLSTNPYAQELRKRNLVKLFGDAFEEYIFLDTGADKNDVLREVFVKYGKRWWIEDKPENVDVGIDMGFDGLLVEHRHNLDYKGKAIVVKDWQEICNIITKGRDYDGSGVVQEGVRAVY